MVIAQIHNVFKALTSTEKKVASFILSAPEKVVSMTIKELAGACDTVPSAVVRTCRSIGIGGFADLKLALAVDIAKSEHAERLPAFGREDSPETVFNKVFYSGINTLRSTLKMLDFASVTRMAEALAGAERILIFGVGTSSVIATDAAYRFSQLGLQAYAYTDILYMNVMAKNMKAGEVAIGISHSGTTKTVVDAMRHARDAGAKTVAVTRFAKSLLCREAEHAVAVYADEENYPIEAVSARIAHMCVIDALMMTLASMKYDDFTKHVSMRNEILDEIRY